MDNKGYYAILGVSSNASIQEIKHAYRILLLKYHPDRNKSPIASFIVIRINLAYEILSDKEKRRRYDNERLLPESSKAGTTKPYNNHYSSYSTDYSNIGIVAFILLFLFGFASVISSAIFSQTHDHSITAVSQTVSTVKNEAINIPLTYVYSYEHPTEMIVTPPSHGTLSNIDENSANTTYTPKLDFVGVDTFTFKVAGINLGELSNIATVRILVNSSSS